MPLIDESVKVALTAMLPPLELMLLAMFTLPELVIFILPVVVDVSALLTLITPPKMSMFPAIDIALSISTPVVIPALPSVSPPNVLKF